jgi:hypothetical protein
MNDLPAVRPGGGFVAIGPDFNIEIALSHNKRFVAVRPADHSQPEIVIPIEVWQEIKNTINEAEGARREM